MPEQWTADIVGKMHLNGIRAKDLADEVGWNPKYLSVVLNGRRNPKEAEKKLMAALDELISSSTP